MHFTPTKREASQQQPPPSRTDPAATPSGSDAAAAGDAATPLSQVQQQQGGGGSGVLGSVYGTAQVVVKCVALGVKTLNSSSFRSEALNPEKISGTRRFLVPADRRSSCAFSGHGLTACSLHCANCG